MAHDVKKTKSLVLTNRQISTLSGRARRMGVGISEYLRRLLDDPNVIAAMDRIEGVAKDSPDEYIERIAKGSL